MATTWLHKHYEEFEFWTEHDVVRTVQSVSSLVRPPSGVVDIGVGQPVPHDDSLIPSSFAICATGAVVSRASCTPRRRDSGRMRRRRPDSLPGEQLRHRTGTLRAAWPHRSAGSRLEKTTTDNPSHCDHRQTAVSRLRDQPDRPMASSTEKPICALGSMSAYEFVGIPIRPSAPELPP